MVVNWREYLRIGAVLVIAIPVVTAVMLGLLYVLEMVPFPSD